MTHLVMAKRWPSIIKPKSPPTDADVWNDIKDKLAMLDRS